MHAGRVKALTDRMERARSRRTTIAAEPAVTEPDLFAEDLLRGYRVDVRDAASGTFRSLHARRVRYTVDGFGAIPQGPDPFQDEDHPGRPHR